MSFIVSGLPLEPFQAFFGLSDEALAEHGVIRYQVDANPGFPCRITLEDVRLGESVLLLNYQHLDVDSPYRSRHAIFVSETATERRSFVDEVPAVLAIRPAISLRAYDGAGMMLDAALAPGPQLEPVIERLLVVPGVAYLHAHNAGRGCYAARIDRS